MGHNRGGRSLAILKSPPKLPKNETLQLRVAEEIKAKLHKYAEFLNSSDSYVVEALKFLFRKDDEFKNWLEEHPISNDQSGNGVGSFSETAQKA
jgi:hypothetical protein